MPNPRLFRRALSTRPSAILSDADPATFDQIASLLRSILQREDPTWEENRSIHLPYGRRFKSLMKSSSGMVLKGTELSDLVVRLAFIKTLTARFGALENVCFGIDPSSTTFPPITSPECSFTVLYEPVGTVPVLDHTGRKGYRLKGTLPAYFHDPPLGGPSFLDLVKLSAPVPKDFKLPESFEPNEAGNDPHSNEDQRSLKPTSASTPRLDSGKLTAAAPDPSASSSPLSSFTIEVYPDIAWSPSEILLPDQTFTTPYPVQTRSPISYLEKWERDLWTRGFRHFEGFNGALRETREAAAKRLDLDLEAEARAARYSEELRRAGEALESMRKREAGRREGFQEGVKKPSRAERAALKVQSKKKSRPLEDPALSPSPSPLPSPLPPPTRPPVLQPSSESTFDRSLPPHLQHTASLPMAFPSAEDPLSKSDAFALPSLEEESPPEPSSETLDDTAVEHGPSDPQPLQDPTVSVKPTVREDIQRTNTRQPTMALPEACVSADTVENAGLLSRLSGFVFGKR